MGITPKNWSYCIEARILIYSKLENENRHGEEEHDIELIQRNARSKRIILCELGCLANELRYATGSIPWVNANGWRM